MHRLQFDFDDVGKSRYEMCYQAIAMAPSDFRVPTDEWDDVIGLVKKLKSIGEPAAQKINGQTVYDLQEGGGEILLERGEYKLLVKFVSLPIWRPLAIEEAQNLKKWLEAVPRETASASLKEKRKEA